MKKLLTATTALALVGGAAFAEITISGDAKLGLDYNSDPAATESKHSFKHEMGVDFTGSGTTDGGLSFGAKAGFDTGDAETNEGTVWVSSDFGKITIGANDSADLLAGGIADVGLNGIGVDDVAEGLRGQTANAFRYDHTFGPVSIAVSGGTKAGTAGTPKVDAIEATQWWHQGTTSALSFYGAMPTEDQMNEVFGIVRTVTSGSISAVTQNNEDILGHGYAHDADGNVLTSATGAKYAVELPGRIYRLTGTTLEIKATDAETYTAVASNDRPSGAEQTALGHYVKAYSLGANKAVGGDDDTNIVAVGHNGVAEVAAVAGTSSTDEYAFGMSFAAGGMTVGFGHDSNDTNSVGLGFSMGEIATNLLYVKADTATGMGADVAYTMGASTLTLAYAKSDPDMGDSSDAMGLHVDHDLGGGATLKAGFGQVDDANEASMGISFAF